MSNNYGKEYKIGEIFRYNNIYLEVIYNKEGNCADCYLSKNNKKFIDCQLYNCIFNERSDNTNVLFVECHIKKIRKLKLEKINKSKII